MKELRIHRGKTANSYVDVAKELLKEDADGELQISALASTIPLATEAAEELRRSGAVTVSSVSTSLCLADSSRRATPQLCIVVARASAAEAVSSRRIAHSLADGVAETAETKVFCSEDGRGHATMAAKSFAKGDILFREPALAIVYPTRDPPWLASLRDELKQESEACAWQYCMATFCLAAEELPSPPPAGLQALDDAGKRRLQDLCGEDDEGLGPSVMAKMTAKRLLEASESVASGSGHQWPTAATAAAGKFDPTLEFVTRWLGKRLDDVAARISRNGFQVMDLKARPPTSADGLFHRISFFNHCCAGLNNASWFWDGSGIVVKAIRDVQEGEELTISYIAKPWCDLATAARRRYLEQNFNFHCLCKACTQPAAADGSGGGARGGKANVDDERVGKLGGLLLRWMKEDHNEDGPAKENNSGNGIMTKSEGSSAVAKKAALTDAERLDRVLQRCQGEELGVTREDAEWALAEEDGHVGRAMILLRKLDKAPGPAGEAKQQAVVAAIAAAAAPLTPEKSDAPAAPRGTALTAEERLERVLKRCEGEGLEAVTADMAREALAAEDGHVGKAMIRLRKQLREQAAAPA
eukprot:TRINITY_DN51564_c0_g1_i1.p1 TRINITY_DN51564_c0_g1~~TRINITY_DN51564_c0_g1_i1.p1  ORF type:complete len:585 (-),score=167.65 TRINITY_DN51564_c0_g1_i1:7-1761(-)